MSTQAHTPTPLVIATGKYSAHNILTPDGYRYASAYGEAMDQRAAHIVVCLNVHDDLMSALEEALEFIERHIGVDVVDGDYGEPKPDRAMQVAMMLKRTLDKVQA